MIIVGIEGMTIIGLQLLWLLSNRTPNIYFSQIGLQTLLVNSNGILIQLTMF